ncbi:MAG: PIG-L family deacetylase [Acidimicrobiales bacterium]
MAVHAHPDDEASSTGGVLARYAAEGIRTVLVTCTDGSCGDGAGGVKPGEPGHDPAAVSAMRQVELEASCRALGVDHLELLGYRDSGMMGWSTNDTPGSFWGMDVAAAAGPLAALMERYQPQVVVTYDADGFYGHPDHIMAHRITMAAVETTGIPAKVYFPAIPRSALASFTTAMRAAGIEPPGASDREEGQFADPEEVEESSGPDIGTDDELIAARVDVGAYVDRKFAALGAHASQSDNIFFLRLGDELFAELFGVESFVRARDRTGAPIPETDLFVGLRSG